MIILRKPFDVFCSTFWVPFSALATLKIQSCYSFYADQSSAIMQKMQKDFFFKSTRLIDTTQIKRNSNGIIIIRILTACLFRMKCDVKVNKNPHTQHKRVHISHMIWFDFFSMKIYANTYFRSSYACREWKINYKCRLLIAKFFKRNFILIKFFSIKILRTHQHSK